MSNEENKKLPIRILVVDRNTPAPKSLAAFAQELQDAMNSLLSEGYMIEKEEDRDGLLLIGHLRDEEPSQPQVIPLGIIRMAQAAAAAAAHTHALSPETLDVLRKASQGLSSSKSLAEDLRKSASPLLRGKTVQELQKMAAECEKELSDHSSSCQDAECTWADLIAAFRDLLRGSVTANLQ